MAAQSVALNETELAFLLTWRMADAKGKAQLDAVLAELEEHGDRFVRGLQSAWGERPIASEQDMIDFYRIANPDVGDEFAKVMWRQLQGTRQ